MRKSPTANEHRLRRAARKGLLDETRVESAIKANRLDRARAAKHAAREEERAEADRRLAALMAEGKPRGGRQAEKPTPGARSSGRSSDGSP